MERVSFMIEGSGERIDCLLNPESLDMARRSGVKPRRRFGSVMVGAGLSDDPLIYSGGGTTELRLDLLFDVSLATRGPEAQFADVRGLSRRLWSLSENSAGAEGSGALPVVRFIWGKSWNVPGIIASVAERFEYFTAEGIPRRSWMRIRFLRVEMEEISPAIPAPELNIEEPERTEDPEEVGLAFLRKARKIDTREIERERHLEATGSDRLDLLARRYYGQASSWRLLASYNNISDPLHLPPGTVLRLPPGTST